MKFLNTLPVCGFSELLKGIINPLDPCIFADARYGNNIKATFFIVEIGIVLKKQLRGFANSGLLGSRYAR